MQWMPGWPNADKDQEKRPFQGAFFFLGKRSQRRLGALRGSGVALGPFGSLRVASGLLGSGVPITPPDLSRPS